MKQNTPDAGCTKSDNVKPCNAHRSRGNLRGDAFRHDLGVSRAWRTAHSSSIVAASATGGAAISGWHGGVDGALSVSARRQRCAVPAVVPAPDRRPDRGYGPLLQGPFDFPAASRATVRRELVPGRIWSFEQVQGVIYVHVPVRMTVVKLDSGGLFVYAPVAPTAECLRLLEEIEAQHGPVAHILLPTLAIEHKSFAGAFAGKRPNAQLWVAEAQYSFPLDLPLPLQGFPAGTKYLPPESRASEVPWAAQLPYRALEPLREKSVPSRSWCSTGRPLAARDRPGRLDTGGATGNPRRQRRAALCARDDLEDGRHADRAPPAGRRSASSRSTSSRRR